MPQEDPKDLTNKRPAEDIAQSDKLKQSRYIDQRKDLGASFGTKKAQKVQRNRESNIINTSNIGNVVHCLVEKINETAKSVPSKEFIQAKQDELRPIPRYNLAAERPAEAYPLEGIILPAEVAAMKPQISALKKSSDETSAKSLLGFQRSTYLNERLHRLYDTQDGSKKPDSDQLRIIYFASLLMSLYINRRAISDRDKLLVKLGNPPAALMDSLLSRFTERNVVNNRHADCLLTHIFVLGLYLDNFASELRTLQNDLQIRPPQMATLYKELGCTVAPITESQRLAAGLTKSEAKSLKRAVLKLPLTFPPPKRGPAKR